MNVYCLNFNLAASEHQATLMQQIKSSGGDVIQTGSGLCAKTPMSEDEFKEFIATVANSGIGVEKITGATKDLTPDVKAFLGQ